MALYRRLLALDLPRISTHSFSAAIYEFTAGQKTATDLSTAFGLTAGETTELTTLTNTITGNLAARAQRVAEIHFVLLAAEQGLWYNTEATLKTRLGV